MVRLVVLHTQLPTDFLDILIDLGNITFLDLRITPARVHENQNGFSLQDKVDSPDGTQQVHTLSRLRQTVEDLGVLDQVLYVSILFFDFFPYFIYHFVYGWRGRRGWRRNSIPREILPAPQLALLSTREQNFVGIVLVQYLFIVGNMFVFRQVIQSKFHHGIGERQRASHNAVCFVNSRASLSVNRCCSRALVLDILYIELFLGTSEKQENLLVNGDVILWRKSCFLYGPGF